jgi:hypothetical protein
MQVLGFVRVVSLRTGVRGWNDAEQALQDGAGNPIDADQGDELLAPKVRQEQRKPKGF